MFSSLLVNLDRRKEYSLTFLCPLFELLIHETAQNKSWSVVTVTFDGSWSCAKTAAYVWCEVDVFRSI